MDSIEQMSIACEAIFRSTEKSRARFKKFIDKQKTRMQKKVDAYETYFDMCQQLYDGMTKAGLTDAKAIQRYIQRHGQKVISYYSKNGLLSDPMDFIASYKRALKTLRYRADRNHPDIKEYLDAVEKEINPGGEIYEMFHKLHERMSTDDASAAAAATKHAMQQHLIQQQQQQMFMMQQDAIQQQMMVDQQMQQMMQNQMNLLHHQAVMISTPGMGFM